MLPKGPAGRDFEELTKALRFGWSNVAVPNLFNKGDCRLGRLERMIGPALRLTISTTIKPVFPSQYLLLPADDKRIVLLGLVGKWKSFDKTDFAISINFCR